MEVDKEFVMHKLLEEAYFLEKKVIDLSTFKRGKGFKELEEEQQSLLLDQWLHMTEYLNILRQRIALLCEK